MLIVNRLPLWRQIFSQNYTRLDKLLDFLELDNFQRQEVLALPSFPLNLPKRLAEKMAKGTLNDPLLLQFLPLQKERHHQIGYQNDPVGDSACRSSAKLLKKYSGRVLLVSTSVCAMHCRYCFRQNFDYERKDKSFDEELKLIGEDQTIKEVILSGGDPLSLSNEVINEFIERISHFKHVTKIRFHSRFPIGIPERIDEGFLLLLRKSRVQIYFTIHSNHPKELDSDVLHALKLIRLNGAVLLNQSVLLRGVNDSVETLVALSEILVDNGILPYYLHQLDQVTGTSHFEVSQEEGNLIIEGMMKGLPGYAVPRYVQEIAGVPHKIPLTNAEKAFQYS